MSEGGPAAARATLGRLRVLLLGLLLLGSAGTAVELLLLEHVETWRQLLPFAAFGLGAAATLAFLIRPAPATLVALRAAMALLILTGLAGLYLHIAGNIAFELELQPGQSRGELLRHALTGATPVLAPGVMAQIGLLGLAAVWRAGEDVRGA